MKEIDVVLLGATGFTGGLVADYLAQTADPEQVRIALAGRSAEKLTRVRGDMERTDPRWSDVETIRLTSDDDAALAKMAERTRVVATTVGPYAEHGEPLVRACANAGTDYVDLTGEPQWWRAMIDRYHAVAERNDATIVPSCGFDSVPHDLGALFAVQELGQTPAKVRGYVQATGTFSGGTWASAVGIAANVRSLKISGRVHKSEELERWAVPMPTIDPLVVQRSAELNPEFGDGFAYEHYVCVKKLRHLAGIGVGLGAVVGLAQFDALHPLLKRLRPSGSGPSEAKREKGRFRVSFFAESNGTTVRTQVTGHDPGYGHTSKMLAEAALCLAQDRDALPRTGGVLTPASALGEPYRRRLERTGMQFTRL